MSLEPAGVDDLEAIRRIERTPEYALFISASTPAEHAAHLVSTDARLLVWREGGVVEGAALLLRLDSGITAHLKRLAIRRPGRGTGRRFVPALIDWVFTETRVNRLDLDCSAENPRALSVYRREGFVEEGVVREVYQTDDGRFVSSVLFAMLRREWEALRGRGS